MPAITQLELQNFKSFPALTLHFDPGTNVLIGDNATGRSSVLGEDQGLYVYQNLTQAAGDGLRVAIVPLIEDFGPTILELLRTNKESFPFEYYTVQFSTFSGAPHVRYRRPVKHLLIDSSRIDTEYAAGEYTRTVFG
ncbi:AAA family ATPase [Pseudomonas syringae]|uniref:AAA family ATPase n=1 Tax=Pseudomonas syringae TaxID=317 RepID=UPI000421AF01|nr:AAA family ATPase [Pseudomonas syringae]KPY70213.1 Uncharacterized protein ALO45_04073 [Pseudomonas syringae pv. syringae]POR87431.1 hypothetical protein BKM21_01985 [Pseudomonas syringae pv. syringae]